MSGPSASSGGSAVVGAPRRAPLLVLFPTSSSNTCSACMASSTTSSNSSMTVAPVGHFLLRLSAFLMFVSGFVIRVVPILAGPRWVLGHTEDASSLCSIDPCPSPLLHARRGHTAREMGRWGHQPPRTSWLIAPDSGGSAAAAGRSKERLLCDSCGRRGVSSPRRILGTSCSRTCGLTWPRLLPPLPGRVGEDRGLGSTNRDESLGARQPTLPASADSLVPHKALHRSDTRGARAQRGRTQRRREGNTASASRPPPVPNR